MESLIADPYVLSLDISDSFQRLGVMRGFIFVPRLRISISVQGNLF